MGEVRQEKCEMFLESALRKKNTWVYLDFDLRLNQTGDEGEKHTL